MIRTRTDREALQAIMQVLGRQAANCYELLRRGLPCQCRGFCCSHEINTAMAILRAQGIAYARRTSAINGGRQ